MSEIYQKEIQIQPSQCDATGKLGYADCFALFMDIAGEHAEQLNIGLTALSLKNQFWLTTRSKVRLFRRPKMMEKVTISTWPESTDGTRCYRCYRLYKGDEVLAIGKTQWAIMDFVKNTLVDTDDLYPADYNYQIEPFTSMKMEHLDHDFEGDYIGEHQFDFNDIDLGGHVNNIAYLRALFGCYSVNEWKYLKPDEIEIHYNRSCFEKQNIVFSSRKMEEGFLVKGCVEDKPVLLIRVK